MDDRQKRIAELVAAQRKRLTPEQTEQRIARMDELMRPLDERTRLKWCGSERCACTGCANRAGGVEEHGFDKDDHVEWIKRYRAIAKVTGSPALSASPSGLPGSAAQVAKKG